jgi:hypothetical protein
VFTFDVAFDPDGSATGQPLLTILGTLMMATWMVLHTFEERFFADSIANLIPIPLEGQAEYVGTDSFAERAGWRQVSELTN